MNDVVLAGTILQETEISINAGDLMTTCSDDSLPRLPIILFKHPSNVAGGVDEVFADNGDIVHGAVVVVIATSVSLNNKGLDVNVLVQDGRYGWVHAKLLRKL